MNRKATVSTAMAHAYGSYQATSDIAAYRNQLATHCVSHGMLYIQYIDYVDKHVHGDMLDLYALTELEYTQAKHQFNQLRGLNRVE